MGRIKRYFIVLVLAIVLGMLFPVIAADGDATVPDYATVDFILSPDTSSSYEVGFSSVEVKDNATVPGAMPNGIAINTKTDEKGEIIIQDGKISGINDVEHTWFYWKVLSKDTVSVSIKAPTELSCSAEGAAAIPVTVEVLDENGNPVISGLQEGYVFSRTGIGSGLDVESYCLRIETAPVSLSDITARAYEGTITIEIKADGGV